MTSVATVHRELPVFSGEFLDTATPEELAGAGLQDGFAIRDQELPPLANGIHERHMELGVRALRSSGTSPTAVNVSEGVLDPVTQSYDSGEHVDGLVGTYYQGHTTVFGETSFSRFVLRRWMIDADEHAYLQRLLRLEVGASAQQPVMANNPTAQQVIPRLERITSGSEPVEVITHDTKTPYESVVMRNGYDATPEAEAAALWTHQVLSIDENGNLVQKTRRIWFSRINAQEDTARLNGNVVPISAARRPAKMPLWLPGRRTVRR